MATVETDFRLLFWDSSRTRWSFRPEVKTSTSSAPTTKQVCLLALDCVCGMPAVLELMVSRAGHDARGQWHCFVSPCAPTT